MEKVLGNTIPTREYKYKPDEKKIVMIIDEYYDTVLKKDVRPYERYEMTLDRALLVASKGKCKILN